MMRLLFLFALLTQSALAAESDYSFTKYMQVNALSEDATGGFVIPNGQTVGMVKFVAAGADPEAYVLFSYCWGDGAKQKIFATTKGDVNIDFDHRDPVNQVTGDGVCRLTVTIANGNATQTPFIGGHMEANGL